MNAKAKEQEERRAAVVASYGGKFNSSPPRRAYWLANKEALKLVRKHRIPISEARKMLNSKT
jgi:hypothetical protein